jgi:hypothetical protein
MKFICKALMVLVLSLTMAAAASAASINVLWYGDTNIQSAISTFAASAASYGGGLSWNVTFWNPGVTYSNYNVLVIGSAGSGFGLGFDTTGILGASSAIEAARGSRTFLSGQDADYHITAGGQMTTINGAAGFLYNAVDWAGSGTGLGIVAMPDGWNGTGSSWWLTPGSFLYNELNGYVSYVQEESVVIPAATAGYPVNAGLTTAGLSDWGVSAHLAFDKNIPGYISINDAGSHPGYAVTILTESQAGGVTTGSVPLPGAILLFAPGLAGLAAIRRRFKK